MTQDDNPKRAETGCLPDEILEQFAAHRASDTAENALQRTAQHVERCPDCARRLAALEAPARRIVEALDQSRTPPEEPRPSEEALGLYLDGTLDADDRAAVEAHLACCCACQARLVNLYRAVQEARDTTAPLVLAEHPSADQPLLREPRRTGKRTETKVAVHRQESKEVQRDTG